MMKKKFVIGLLLATLGVGAVTLPSCKDTAEDEIQQVKGEQATLKQLLDDLSAKLGACGTTCSEKIDSLKKELEKYALENNVYDKDYIDQTFATLTALYAAQNDIRAINEALKKLGEEGGNGVADLSEEAVNNVESLATALENKDYNINDVAAMGQFAKDAATIADLVAKADKFVTSDQIANFLTADDLAGYLTADDLTNIKEDITKLNEAVFGKDGVGGLINSVAALENRMLKAENRVGDLETIFTKEDGTLLTAQEFKDLLNAGNWVTTNKAAVDEVLKLKNDGLLGEEALKALKEWYENGTVADLTAAYNKLFPDGLPTDGKWYTYPELIAAVDANKAAIETLQNDVAKLFDRYKKMVTGLEIHTAWNPIFGGFNTPFGISSNVLLGYYGQAAQDVDFPFQAIDDAGLKENVFAGLNNVQPETYGGNLYDKRLGTLYFSANPVGANVNLDAFSFENSIMEKAPVELVVKKSDKLLNIGFSRAISENGFYEVSAKLSDDQAVAGQNIQQIKVRLEEGMLEKLKEALTNRTLGNVASLAKSVYNQLQDLCPAYALRYDWTTEDGEENAVLSKYGIAVTAAKPLSFTTLRGSSFNNPLPTIGSIEIDKSIADLGLKEFHIGEIKFDISLSIESITIGELGNTIIEVKVPKKYDVNKETGEAVLPEGWDQNPELYDVVEVDIKDNLQPIVDNIQNSIDEWINGTATQPGLAEQIQSQVQQAVDEAFNGKGQPGDPDYVEGFATSIEKQVNDMMGSIQDKIYDLIDQINGPTYLGRLNNVISYYNRFNDRLTRILKDPNHYLQVCMLYKTSTEGVGFVSNQEGNYTKFKYNGGEGFNLWATTYNFETLAPSYKKFLAVTKVLEDGKDITTPALLAKMNDTPSMAKVLEGYTKAVTVATPSDVIKKGHVYGLEISYRALDYQGKTSTQRFYVLVDAQ